MAKKRAAMSEEEKEMKRKLDAEKKRQKFAELSEEEREKVRKQTAERIRKARAAMSDEERQKKQKKDSKRKAAHKSHIRSRDGLRSQEVLNGTFHVDKLEDSKDAIGEMIHKCGDCGALKFPKETPSSCCSGGKVRLWTDTISKTSRQNS